MMLYILSVWTNAQWHVSTITVVESFFTALKIICAFANEPIYKTKQTQRDQTCGCQDAGVGRKWSTGRLQLVDANYHI